MADNTPAALGAAKTGAYAVRTELRPRGLDGISEDQIGQHWSLYEGYVKNVNTLEEHISGLVSRRQFGVEFAELKRRLGFEYDGMVLHEHYFGALRAGVPAPSEGDALTKQLKRAFGGLEAWRAEFEQLGKIRGVGWVILYLDPRTGRLTNHWVEMHQNGHPAGFTPLLVLDCWEHAYLIDRGVGGRGDYVQAFLRNVDWARVDASLRAALGAPRP